MIKIKTEEFQNCYGKRVVGLLLKVGVTWVQVIISLPHFYP